MTSTATMRLVGLLVLVGMAAGCGDTSLGALPPPDDPLDLVLEWRTYRAVRAASNGSPVHGEEVAPFLDWRLDVRPDGTFRYAWRHVASPDAGWSEVVGSVERVRTSRPTWSLLTQGEPQMVEGDRPGGAHLPEISWAKDLTMGVSDDAPSLGAKWLVQAMDHETARFEGGFAFVADARGEGR